MTGTFGGEKSWSTGMEFTGPPNGCYVWSMSYEECDIDGTYFEFENDCSGAFTTYAYTISGVQRKHAIVPCLVEGSEERCNQIYRPITRPPVINGGRASIEIETTDPSLIFDIEWIGPDGYESNQINIDDLDFGQYCYVLTDVCCNTYEGCIYVCDGDAEESDYEYNSDKDQWCRQITCPTSTTGLVSTSDNEIYEECLDSEDLEYGPWEFQVAFKKCQRTVSYEGEMIGVETKDAESVDYYDEILGVCVRDYYCNGASGDIGYSEQEIPLLGQWQVDIVLDVCYREITCFGEMLEERLEEEIEYEWTYNEFSGQCEGRPFCDGSQVFGAPTKNQFPLSKGFWNYDNITQECYRTVQCDIDLSSTSEERIDAGIEWAYDEFTDQCEATVFCDGFEVLDAFIPNVNPFDIEVTVTTSGPTCTRRVQCTFDSPVEIETETGELRLTTDDPVNCPTKGTTYAIYCFGEDTGETICGTAFRGEESNNEPALDLTDKLSMSVSPNPFKDHFTLQIESYLNFRSRIKIVDITGKTVKTLERDIIEGTNLVVTQQMNDLPGGIYFVLLMTRQKQMLSQIKLLKVD